MWLQLSKYKLKGTGYNSHITQFFSVVNHKLMSITLGSQACLALLASESKSSEGSAVRFLRLAISVSVFVL